MRDCPDRRRFNVCRFACNAHDGRDDSVRDQVLTRGRLHEKCPENGCKPRLGNPIDNAAGATSAVGTSRFADRDLSAAGQCNPFSVNIHRSKGSSMKAIRITTLLAGAGLMLFGPGFVAAQGVTVTPMVGAYIPAGSFRELEAAVGPTVELERSSTLGLGLNIGFGSLRASIAYVSGATISREGVTGEEDIGDGDILVGTADFVFRPLPKLIVVQPY